MGDDEDLPIKTHTKKKTKSSKFYIVNVKWVLQCRLTFMTSYLYLSTFHRGLLNSGYWVFEYKEIRDTFQNNEIADMRFKFYLTYFSLIFQFVLLFLMIVFFHFSFFIL